MTSFAWSTCKIGVADRQRPAVAEVADLVLVQAVVVPTDGDGVPRHRHSELSHVDHLAPGLVVARYGHQDLVVLLVALVVGAADVDDVAAIEQRRRVERGQRRAGPASSRSR